METVQDTQQKSLYHLTKYGVEAISRKATIIREPHRVEWINLYYIQIRAEVKPDCGELNFSRAIYVRSKGVADGMPSATPPPPKSKSRLSFRLLKSPPGGHGQLRN